MNGRRDLSGALVGHVDELWDAHVLQTGLTTAAIHTRRRSSDRVRAARFARGELTCTNMSGDELDGPQVAPDRPRGSGDRGPRIAIAVFLSVVAFILAAAATVLILLVL